MAIATVLWLVTCVFLINIWIVQVLCQEVTDPCDSTENVIQLPAERKCLVYHNDAKHWVEAASICEWQSGSLYILEDGELMAGQGLRNCLLSTPDTSGKLDFWIGATSAWSPKWMWVNGSYVNPLLTCTRNYTALTVPTFDVCSKHLSVDYCVSVCRQEGAPFSVIDHRIGRKHPCCWCSYQLDLSQIGVCPHSTYTRGESEYLSVFSSFSRFGTTIVLKSSEALAQTETLCARVNLDTTTIRELSSQSCFTHNHYLCDLGNTTECTLVLKGHCVFVGQTWVTWFTARAECRKRGGDLLIVNDVDDMYEIIPYIKLNKNYWIGAYNHIWNFAPGSDVFSKDPNYVAKETTCGHMYNQGNTWQWADTSCDSRKPFYCLYDSIKYAIVELSEEEDDYICPWEIVVPSEPPVPPTYPPTDVPVITTDEASAIPSSTKDGGGFPLSAVIAACVAALLLLLLALLALLFARRRQWIRRRMRHNSKSDRVYATQHPPKRMYHRWSNPYNYYPDHLSDGGWDSMSTHKTGIRSDISVVSAPPLTSYLKDGRGLTRAYTFSTPADLDTLYANINNKKNDIIRRPTSKSVNHSYQGLGSGTTATSGFGGSEPGADLDRTMASLHQSDVFSAREYMTLAARMNIQDDTGTVRLGTVDRPEVTLVTDDVDLNFTVNHAITKNRTGSEKSSDRTIEEIELPNGKTVELPTSTQSYADFVMY